MSKFGWSYPAGAANDPNAPYNQEPDPCNDACIEAFLDYEGPHDLYHSVYRHGDVGHTIGFSITGIWGAEGNVKSGPDDFEESRDFYCDDLIPFGTWEDMDSNGFVVTHIMISSIVEGVDECTSTITVDWDQFNIYPKELAEKFWKACDDITKEVEAIWMDTHGCDSCRVHFSYIDELEYCPVWSECPECWGKGIPI